MTRLEWRYLQKVALDHPYFDTHKLPLTEAEADALVKAGEPRTGKEFVDSVYAELGMSRPKKQKEPFGWLTAAAGLFRVPPIRRIAIAVLVVVLMTAFFTATPTGRAVAESVIHYIISVFDGGIDVHPDSESSMMPEDNSYDDFGETDLLTDNATYGDIIKFAKKTGYNPVILRSEEYRLTTVKSIVLGTDYCQLACLYSNGSYEIMVIEYWGCAQGIRVAQKDGDIIIDKSVLDGKSLTGYYNNDSMEFYAIISLNDSIVTVSASCGQDYDMIINSLSFFKK